MTTLVRGIYGDAEAVPKAIEALIQADFTVDDISVVVVDASGEHDVPLSFHSAAEKRLEGGAALGAALAALGTGLVVTGATLASGGTLLAAGPVVAVLEATVAGGAAGGALGALSGLDHWKAEVDLHAEDLHGGSVLVGVHADGERIDQAAAIFERTGATKVSTGESGGATAP